MIGYFNIERQVLEMQKVSNTTEISGSYSIIKKHSDKGPNMFRHEYIFGQVSKAREV